MRPSLSLAAALAAAACGAPGGPSSGGSLPDVRLATLGGPPGPSLATCPTEKCLTVLVAPWCGVCHAVAPDVVRLRRHLDGAGVSSRVVVGLAAPEELRGFAAEFGPDAQLDPGRALPAAGVPLFIVSDRGGRVLGRTAGWPRLASTMGELAAAFGLP